MSSTPTTRTPARSPRRVAALALASAAFAGASLGVLAAPAGAAPQLPPKPVVDVCSLAPQACTPLPVGPTVVVDPVHPGHPVHPPIGPIGPVVGPVGPVIDPGPGDGPIVDPGPTTTEPTPTTEPTTTEPTDDHQWEDTEVEGTEVVQTTVVVDAPVVAHPTFTG